MGTKRSKKTKLALRTSFNLFSFPVTKTSVFLAVAAIIHMSITDNEVNS